MIDSTPAIIIGLVHFDLKHECQTQATQMRHGWHKCDMSDRGETQGTRVRHEEKILILVTIRKKTPILPIWQMKDYKERNNIILRTTFWKCLVHMQKNPLYVKLTTFLLARTIEN